MKTTIFLLLSTFAITIFSNDNYEMVIKERTIPEEYWDETQNITIIKAKDLKNREKLNSLLDHIPGLIIESRGDDSQLDLYLRGGTFEQVVLFIDGVRWSSPQTGHHTFDIPIPLSLIEKIEIIKGHSASKYGVNGFSGVINIYTKVGNKRSLFGDLTIGTNYLKKLSLSTTLGDKKKGIIFSGYGGKQDSYVKQTSWKNYGFFLKGDYNLSIGKFNILSALSHKEFGLNNYYSENFDNEWEETDSLFIKLGYEKKFDYINIFCNLGFKRYKDHFILDYDNPKFYQNKHNSNIFSTNCGSKIKTILGDTTVGVELLFNSINSETLGDHSETIKTIFFTHKYQYNYWLFTFASSLLIDNEYTILSPSLELGYSVKNVGKLFISIGQGVRSPTYTEKYYNSPVNSGDPNLNYEVINSIETGFFYSPNIFQFKGAMFYRKGENLIDWVKSSDDIVWKVDNITSIKSYGLELESSLKYKGILISSSYLIEKVEGNYNGMESKYGLNYPEKQFLFSFISSKPYPFKEIIDIKYLKVNKQKSYILFDIGFSIVTHNSEFIFKINNLFDQNYYKLSGIKGKGIEYMFTYKVNISQL